MIDLDSDRKASHEECTPEDKKQKFTPKRSGVIVPRVGGMGYRGSTQDERPRKSPLAMAPSYANTTIGGNGPKTIAMSFNVHNAEQMGRILANKEFFVGSAEQAAIWEAMLHGTENIIVNAAAGSGKTTTSQQGLLRMMRDMDASARSCTYHSLGYSICRKNFPALARSKPNQFKLRNIIDEIERPLSINEDEWYSFSRALGELVKFSKIYLLDGTERDRLEEIADFFGVEVNDKHADLVYEFVPKVIRKCLDKTNEVDYQDMIFFPAMMDLKGETYDLLIADECFVGDTPILLADGTTKPIRELVESKYDGRVKSYDVGVPGQYGGGSVKDSKVIGWHKVAVSKPMLRVTIRRVGYDTKGNRLQPATEYQRNGHRFLVCTEDHRCFSATDNDWTVVKDLKIGDRLIEESIAPKVLSYKSRYKIGNAGKKRLGKLMRVKNNAGTCGSSRTFGHPPIRGGNGTGPTAVEQAMLSRLGDGWKWNHAIPTKSWGQGYSSCYKVDIANPDCMIAIELDGNSHNVLARKEQDKKKDRLLKKLGWSVLRISNVEAIRLSDKDLADKLREAGFSTTANSPVACEVVAIERWLPNEPFVYDITVENTHCYFADGILVHNCQDVSPDQRKLFQLACPNGRIMGIGDSWQSLYSWRGAGTDSMERLREMLAGSPRSVLEYPLTVTRRCPKSHVHLAQAICGDGVIEAMPDASEGVIRVVSESQAISEMRAGDLVLCRVNRFLVPVAYDLIRRGVKAIVRGRDIGQGLESLIKRLTKDDPNGSTEFLLTQLRTWAQNETRKLRAMGDRAAGRIQSLEDNVETVIALTENVETIPQVLARIDQLFKDFDDDGKPLSAVVLGTIHRTKGLQSDRVFVLKPELLPHPMAGPNFYKGELCAIYVAVTRAKWSKEKDGELIFCGPVPEPIRDAMPRLAQEVEDDYEDYRVEIEDANA